MNRIAFGRLAQRRDHRLEPLFEITPETRAGEQRAGVEREDLRILQSVLQIAFEEARRKPFGHGRLADPGFTDEHRVVLAPTAQHLDRSLQLLGTPDERVEQTLPRPSRQVQAVGAKRIASRDRAIAIGARFAAARGAGAVGHRRLRDPVRDVLEDVEPGDSLFGQQPRRIAFRLLEHRRQNVADLCLVALCALDVKYRLLQHPPECRGLLRFALLASCQLLNRFAKVGVKAPPQAPEIGAAGAENPFAVRIMGEAVQQMLERQIGVAPRHRFAERNVEDDFNRGREHQASSMAVRSGWPASLASAVTVPALVSATSHG